MSMSVESTPNNLPIPKIPSCLQQRTFTKGLISCAEAMKLDGHQRAAHVCLWAPQEGRSPFGVLRAAVMCQHFHYHRVVVGVSHSQLLTLNVGGGVHPSRQHAVIRLTCAFLRKTGQLQRL
ncbi:hypothetical protein GWK47_041845 [Chionoecetes opilio]|uniref:Uncharacterized protein n=1 Tax=Chionoecetes opilio TaxID=41210 RepID=A0A8J4YAU3_CHIOP|nr:hypothetical protein GWK47_041845 [Chionoecetes opilio]